MTDLVIPADLKPADGRFGCGPSRVRPEQVAALAAAGTTLLGTSHRQRPVRALVGSVRRQVAELFRFIFLGAYRGGFGDRQFADFVLQIGSERFERFQTTR